MRFTGAFASRAARAWVVCASVLLPWGIPAGASMHCAAPAGEGVLACKTAAGAINAPAVTGADALALRIELASDSRDDLLAALGTIDTAYGSNIDWRAGIAVRGRGAGGGAAIAQTAALRDDDWREAIRVVHAESPEGHYAGAFSRAAASGALDHMLFRVAGSTSRGLDRGLFRLCERHRIACVGAWTEGGSADLPAADAWAQAGVPRQGELLAVFTGSTANDWGRSGHYNLGLDWDPGGVLASGDSLRVPLRYRQSAAPGLPEGATFDLTLRGSPALARQAQGRLQWRLGDTGQRGTATVAANGEVFLEGLTLASAETFTALQLERVPFDWQLVYTRQPRATRPVPGTPVKEAANWQHATDVGRINGGLAEADIVIDDLNGTVKVVHDCTGSNQICVAHEARVSPDGTKIVYSVGYGNQLVPVRAEGVDVGLTEIPGLTHAELWIYDLESGKKWPIPGRPPRAIDRQPEWLNNEKIVFASNRGETYPFKNPFGMHQGKDQFGRGRCFNAPYCVSQEYGYGRAGMSMQLWTMNIDGSDPRNISPHEQHALAPAVMSNGDILYSCWNAHENKNYDAHTAHSNLPQTAKNKWWLCRTDGNGADQTVILNGHKTTTLKTREWLPRGTTGGEGRSMLRAIRSVAEIFEDKLAVSNYYRSNHVGSLGIIYGMDYGDPHVEGCSTARCYPDGESASTRPGSGRYVPSSLRAITPYGTDQDNDVRRDALGRALGKSGYAAPLPNTDSEFLITHGRGSCYEATRIQHANRRAMGGEPTCQKGIYRVKVPMVTDPFDTDQMELMAGGDEWQVWDARAIAPYEAFFGKPLPDQPAPLDEDANCYLQVVDARAAELYPGAPEYDWRGNLYEQCAFQGCAVNTEDPGFHRREMAALTVFLPEMWDITYSGADKATYQSILNNTGHKSVATLGSQPVLEDGSVKMQVPCETPLIMTGTDRDGMVIAHDTMLHSLRAGETRTCHGCHDGHSEERAAQIDAPAVERFATTLAARTLPPMPEREPPVTFDQVRPILEQRCSGCHKDMTDRDGLLYSRVAQDYEQFDWPWARKQPGQGQHTGVEHVLIRSRGTGYSVGDRLIFAPGGAQGEVARVGRRGQIMDIRMKKGGSGYPPMSNVEVKSAAGSGARLKAMTSRFHLSRPYSSKWVAKFARDSLLYWKCMGSRQDGRTDDQYRNDIDFGPAHESGATPEECRLIGRWIDTGIQHLL